MKKIISLSYQLLDLTRKLKQVAESGELEELDHLQDERAKVIVALDSESRNNYSADELQDCQLLLNEARLLEKGITDQLNALRDHIRDTHDQMSISKQAMKAYDKFR